MPAGASNGGAGSKIGAGWMTYDGTAVRQKLAAMRDALTAARERTELDPYDEAMFGAIHAMLEVNEAHSVAVEGMMKAARKLERRLR